MRYGREGEGGNAKRLGVNGEVKGDRGK